jgi:hypothetical protein
MFCLVLGRKSVFVKISGLRLSQGFLTKNFYMYTRYSCAFLSFGTSDRRASCSVFLSLLKGSVGLLAGLCYCFFWVLLANIK